MIKRYFLVLKNFLFYFIILMFLELSFSIIMGNISIKQIIHVLLFSTIISVVLSIICNLFSPKFNVVINGIILFLLGLLFSVQCVFYNTFKVYFSLFNLGLSDQALAFFSDMVHSILSNIVYILIFMIPFVFYLPFYKKIDLQQNKLKHYMLYLILLFVFVPTLYFHISINNNKKNDIYDLFHNENSISLNVKKLGVMNSYVLDIYRYIYGFSPKIHSVSIPDSDEMEKVYYYNTLDIDFSKEAYNDSIASINNYMLSDKGTLKNDYTGMFKDYNLVYITAESFSQIAISEELTPTLYKMTHSGFIFENFYTPNVLSTIGGEYQVLTGLYPDSSILSIWREGTNYYPYGLANVFGSLGYRTYAYHNNWYGFQDRHIYMASQGFYNYKGCYNGMENLINCEIWPESDVEMMDATFGEYAYGDSPFLAYFMTVSGHFRYTFDDNMMAYKNRDAVSSLSGLSEGAQAYVATQIELDRALELLVNKLNEVGKLDKTVFVLMADHYPYELDIDSINSLSSYYRDTEIEINHNSLIIWNSEMEDVTVSKVCMGVDVLPTIYNLFGVNYDSRLLMGKDILSSYPGIAVMADRSWVSDYGVYHAWSGEFVPNKEIPEGHIELMHALAGNKLNISYLIMENNYYSYLFQ